MTHDRGERGDRRAGGEAVARPAADRPLAPVAYLPWVRPSDDAAQRSSDGAAQRPSDESARRPADGRARREQLGDNTETGAERDARLDRLIVARLRRSQLTVAEVRSLLVEHGLDDDETAEWIERYERLGYLDDRRAAEQLVRVHHERRGRGSALVRQELLRRGIDEGVAGEALDAIDESTELDAAMRLAARRAAQLRGLDEAIARRRLTAFLQRRGYSGSVLREAVGAALPGPLGHESEPLGD